MHRAFRIKNLIIILLTQWAVWYMVFDKNSDVVRIPSAMSYLDIIILGIITTMLAIGAYLINDVYDLEADKHNGIERLKDKRKTLLTYWLVNGIGLILSVYVALKTQSLGLLWIYPLAVLVLYLYSRLLKGTPLMGNFIVSLFCALVPGILFLAERNMITEWKVIDPNGWKDQRELLWMFVLFSFLSSMYREQVKDLEDAEGDKAAGYLTLPVVYGEKRARALSIFSGILLLISIVIYATYHWTMDIQKSIPFIVLMSLLLWSLQVLCRAYQRSQYSKASKIIKYAMIAGVLYLLMPV